ncbi:hypothetical protein LTR16_012690, partial [Cryomyces antarcticus]
SSNICSLHRPTSTSSTFTPSATRTTSPGARKATTSRRSSPPRRPSLAAKSTSISPPTITTSTR